MNFPSPEIVQSWPVAQSVRRKDKAKKLHRYAVLYHQVEANPENPSLQQQTEQFLLSIFELTGCDEGIYRQYLSTCTKIAEVFAQSQEHKRMHRDRKHKNEKNGNGSKADDVTFHFPSSAQQKPLKGGLGDGKNPFASLQMHDDSDLDFQ